VITMTERNWSRRLFGRGDDAQVIARFQRAPPLYWPKIHPYTIHMDVLRMEM
jgi:hypothetical protein